MNRPDVPPFRQIATEHSAFILRTLQRLGVRACDLDDVTQAVLCAVARGLDAFDPSLCADPSNALRAWLVGICQRQAASARRCAARRGVELLSEQVELDAHPTAAASAEDAFLEHERVALLDRLLGLLDPHRRAVVLAYDVRGLAMAEVAVALGIPVNTAWNRRRLGLDDLRAAWRRIAVVGDRRSR